MKKELDEALVRDFPNLYAQRYGSMMGTCMCWGFSCGSGWEPLIRRLSEKLEKIIVDSGIPNKVAEEKIYMLKLPKIGQDAEGKWGIIDEPEFTNESLETHLDKHPWIRQGKTWNEEEKSYIRYDNPIWGVCASQVKEKFGTLRFYMAGYLPGMDEAIEEAEKESAKTCEECGKPGKLYDDGWCFTACKECKKARS